MPESRFAFKIYCSKNETVPFDFIKQKSLEEEVDRRWRGRRGDDDGTTMGRRRMAVGKEGGEEEEEIRGADEHFCQ
jgi:hypothetical protein